VQLIPTKLAGAFLVEATAHADERGQFARTYDASVFAHAGLPVHWPQCNTSFNHRRGTLRGLHYQAEPKGEPKLVRCTRGAVFDVAVDLRDGSATRHQWVGVELSADNRRALFIPTGFAHGFLTLEDQSEVFYQMGETYDAALARGVRWNDPAFHIEWPIAVTLISARDAGYSDCPR
jgi:dTDP-4-dehydrorhamnose 3,5-epimerase